LIETIVERFDDDLDRYKLLRKELFEYNHFGNISLFINNNYADERLSFSATKEYEYDNKNNLTAELSITYDSLENLISQSGTFHEYNLENQLIKTTKKLYKPDVDLWITEEWTEFTYDNDGCVKSRTDQENSILSPEEVSIYTTNENCRIIKEEYIPDPGHFSTYDYDLDDYGSHSSTTHEATSFSIGIYPRFHYEELYNEYGDQKVSSILTRSVFLDTTNFYAEVFHYDYVIDPSTNQITSKSYEKYTIDYPFEQDPRFRWSAEYNYEYNCDGTVKVETRKDLDIFPTIRYHYFYEGQLDCFDFEQDLDVTISPNPSLGQIEIQSNLLASGNTTLKVFTSDGKLVGEKLLLPRFLKQNMTILLICWVMIPRPSKS